MSAIKCPRCGSDDASGKVIYHGGESAHCQNCKSTFTIDGHDLIKCPDCGSRLDLIKGKEIYSCHRCKVTFKNEGGKYVNYGFKAYLIRGDTAYLCEQCKHSFKNEKGKFIKCPKCENGLFVARDGEEVKTIDNNNQAIRKEKNNQMADWEIKNNKWVSKRRYWKYYALIIVLTLVFSFIYRYNTNNTSTENVQSSNVIPSMPPKNDTTNRIEFITSPCKYSIVNRDPAHPMNYDVLITKHCSKENIRWIVKELCNKYGSKISIHLVTNKNVFKIYNDFYNKEDAAFHRAEKAVTDEEYQKAIGYYGTNLKEKVIAIEKFKVDNFIAGYEDGNITYFDNSEPNGYTEEKYP